MVKIVQENEKNISFVNKKVEKLTEKNSSRKNEIKNLQKKIKFQEENISQILKENLTEINKLKNEKKNFDVNLQNEKLKQNETGKNLEYFRKIISDYEIEISRLIGEVENFKNEKNLFETEKENFISHINYLTKENRKVNFLIFNFIYFLFLSFLGKLRG